jgi:hypothetical protein
MKHRENTEAMDIVYVPIKDLNPATYNPRKLTAKGASDIRASLEKFGFVKPLVVNKNGSVIVEGHQRVKVWGEMGNATVPVYFVDLDESAERELNIRLNLNNGDWDFEMLKNEFPSQNLDDWGFDTTGFKEEAQKKERKKKSDDGSPTDSVECPHCGELFDIGVRVKQESSWDG